MEPNSANLNTQVTFANDNIDDQSAKNTIENQNQKNANNQKNDISIIEQLPKFNDSSPQLQNQQIKLIDCHIKTSNPTIIVELSDDENDKEINDQNNNLDNSQHNQDNNILSQNFISNNQNATNQFLLANLSQGQTFLNNDNSFTTQINPISSLISSKEIHHNPNLNDIQNTNMISNDENNILLPKNIPELRRSGQSDSNLYESKTPSNITTEENSPRSRPFSPETLNSPGSPPHIENYDQSEKNDELQFKSLTIYGNNKEDADNENNDQNEYNEHDMNTENQEENHEENHEENQEENENNEENENHEENHEENQEENENNEENEAQNHEENQEENENKDDNQNKPFHIHPVVMRIKPNPYPNIFSNPQMNQNEFTGLQNQGATCYMNSMLQALYHLPIFRRFIYQMDYSEAASDEQNIPLNLQRLFAMMQLRIRPSVPTKELTNSFGWTAHETYMQHDVQEFCRVILDNIETKMKKQENLKDAIGYLFRGKARSEIRLKNGEVENSNTEEFYDLSMIVKDTNSLEESFSKYIEPEEISDYDTEKNGKQEITKTVEFVQFPPVLYLHLRRFEYDPELQNMKKINSRFEFPESIDLSQFMAEDADQEEDQIFDLFGVLVHHGSSYGGHYFAYLRPSGEEDEWYLFNDSSVTKATKEEAIESNYGGPLSQNGISFDKSYSAYMLIYIRRSRIPEFYEEVDDSEIPESAANYVHEKKISYERQIEEKRRIENTLSFRLIRNEDLRKNALVHDVEFNIKRNSLVSIDAMKYDLPEDLYEKVAKLLKLKKFILYGVELPFSIEEINRNSNTTLQNLYCKNLFVYSDFKENRVMCRQSRYRNRSYRQRRFHNQPQIDDDNGNGNVNENDENFDNENQNKNFDQVGPEDENNDNNDNDNNDDDDDNNYNENENENESLIDDDDNIIYDYEEEEERSDDNEEEEEESDEENNYGYYHESNPTILVFYYIYIQNMPKHPVRFWRADLVKAKWRVSRICDKCDRILKIYPKSLYANTIRNQRFKQIDPESRLRNIENGSIIIFEIDGDLPPMIESKDNKILQRMTEEEEEEEEEAITNYLYKNPTKSFKEFLNYHEQVTISITHDENTRSIKIPVKITNKKLIKFVKRTFKISKLNQLVFYSKKSKTPLDIIPNDVTFDRVFNATNDAKLFVYNINSNISFDMFRDNMRVSYFTGDGYIQFKSIKYVFMSKHSTVQDLINHRYGISQKDAEYRVITIHDGKIQIEDNYNYINELPGRIRIEEVPYNEDDYDFEFQLNISKDAAYYLRIFNTYHNKNVRKAKYYREIECIFPGKDNEMLPDTKRRIAEVFNCDESLMDQLSYTYESPDSISSYRHPVITDNEGIFEYVEKGDEKFLILYVDVIQQSNTIYSLPPSSIVSKNHDSIYIQN